MKTITLFLWCLAGLVLGTVAVLGQNPTPIANLQRATTVAVTNIIPVVTNPGQTNGTKGVELDDFLASLVGFPGWPSASVTNAIGTIKTNGVTITNAATTLDFIQGSNTVLRTTNSGSGVVTIQINSAASGGSSSSNYTVIAAGHGNFGGMLATNDANLLGNVVASGTNIVSGKLRLPTIATNTLLFHGVESNVVGLAVGNLASWSSIPTGAMANVVSTDYLTNWANAISNLAVAGIISPSATAWSNSIATVTNGGTLFFDAGTFTITPTILQSNISGNTLFTGATLKNKTNVTIYGIPGKTVIDGSSGLGELLLITNCSNVRISGITFKGYTNHNYMVLPDFPGSWVWASVSILRSEHLIFDNVEVRGSADHGIIDFGSTGGNTVLSTNVVIVKNSLFHDIGSYRTNTAGGVVQQDGAAVVAAGGWVVENNTFIDCLRGVEPYDDGTAGYVSEGTVIRNNKFFKCINFFVGPSGSTNNWNVIVEGNVMENPITGSWHGTNYGSGGPVWGTQGIYINGGRGWMIRNNWLKGGMYVGIRLDSPVYFIDDSVIEGNTIHDVNQGDGLGYGMLIGDGTDLVASGSSVRRLRIRGNFVSRSALAGIVVASGRDVTIEDNYVFSPTIWSSYDPAYAGISVGTTGTSLNKMTNVVVKNNRVLDTANLRNAFVYKSSVNSGLAWNNSAEGVEHPYTNLSTSITIITDEFEPVAGGLVRVTNSTTRLQTLMGGVTVGTNGTTVGIGTNINWTTGVTGYVSGATLNLGVSASGGSSTFTNIGRGLYAWPDGLVNRAAIYDDLAETFSATPNGEGALITSGTPAGTATIAATAAVSGSRMGGRGGIVSLRQFNTNISSYACLVYRAIGAATPTMTISGDTVADLSAGFDAAGNPITNCVALIGAFTRFDMTTATSGMGWVANPSVNDNWGCFAVNNSTTSVTNYVGPSLMSSSNVLYRFGFKLTSGTDLVFTTNGVPAFTNASATTMPTNTVLMVGARLSTIVTNIGVLNYSLGVDRVEVYER